MIACELSFRKAADAQVDGTLIRDERIVAVVPDTHFCGA